MMDMQTNKLSLKMPAEFSINVGCSIEEFNKTLELGDRKLYLSGPISSVENDESDFGFGSSMAEWIAQQIITFNSIDEDVDVEDRDPIRLYINSPGGELVEGIMLASVIELSTTPVYTINMGQWSSAAFLIGIAGKHRISLPYSTFLMHDGSYATFGSANKVQDRVKFEERFEEQIVKPFILKHSNMKEDDYDNLARVEYYMLPEDAVRHGFIDEVVSNLSSIY